MTLIEIMAALALLSTLLVVMLAAHSGHQRQWTTANDRLAAVTAADQLLAQWWLSETGVPRADHGEVRRTDVKELRSDQGRFRWRTFVLTNETADVVSSEVIRLEILHSGSPNDGDPLVQVDVLVPRELPARAHSSEVR